MTRPPVIPLAVLLLAPLLAPLLTSTAAHAESHAVTVHNGAPETIRAIQVGPPGRPGENRMRSQLPPGAEARITYSTGCQADLRLTYATGQTEDHPGLDLCTDPHVTAGQSGTPGPVQPLIQPAAQTTTPSTRNKPTPAATHIDKTPVPPWTGHSITRRFGGMD